MNVIDVNKVMDEKMGTICFTGHRPNRLAGYNSSCLLYTSPSPRDM